MSSPPTSAQPRRSSIKNWLIYIGFVLFFVGFVWFRITLKDVRRYSHHPENSWFSQGLRYDQGQGVSPDPVKAREWYEKAAGAGNVKAMNNLGVLYEQGRGVPQDYVKAREWYAKSAAAGDARAMTNLAQLYEQGKGGPPDLASARAWYQKAAAQGEPDAKLALARLARPVNSSGQ